MNPIQFLEFVVRNPILIVPLLLLVLAWPILRRIMGVLDGLLDRLKIGQYVPQFAYFIYLLHLLVATASFIICWAFSDLWPSTYSSGTAEIVGEETERFMGYLLHISIAFIPLLATYINAVAKQSGTRIDPIMTTFAAVFAAPYLLFGLAGAGVVVTYMAFSPTPGLAHLPNFSSSELEFFWWYLMVPMASVSLSVVSFLVACIVRFLWMISGRMV